MDAAHPGRSAGTASIRRVPAKSWDRAEGSRRPSSLAGQRRNPRAGSYQERPERYEYHLTRNGRDLHVALVGLRQWGDEYCSEKPPMLARTKSDKKPVIAALVPKRSDHLRLEEVEFVPGPGRGSR